LSQDPEIDIEAMIDKLVQEIGADEAIRRIRARKVKGRGRPKGLKYQRVDQQLLSVAAALAIEREKRLPQGKRPLSKHALLTKIVDLCSDWEAREILGISGKLDDAWWGQNNPSSIVKRLMSRVRTAKISAKDSPKEGTATPLMPLPKGLDGGLAGFCPPSEAWEKVHRARPHLRLLSKACCCRSEKIPTN
jgi:hypothetical protein